MGFVTSRQVEPCFNADDFAAQLSDVDRYAVSKYAVRRFFGVRGFRPISIWPTLSKLFERILKRQISNHLVSNELLSRLQSGFRPGYSTVTV